MTGRDRKTKTDGTSAGVDIGKMSMIRVRNPDAEDGTERVMTNESVT